MHSMLAFAANHSPDVFSALQCLTSAIPVWCVAPWLAGDSRAVLSRAGVAIQVTDDHKPEREDEAVSLTSRSKAASLVLRGACCMMPACT
jgi:hypothetical protein